MSSSLVCNEVSGHLSKLWECDNDETKKKIHDDYMKIFTDVWRESVSLFNNTRNPESTSEKPKEQEIENVTTENMEDVEIRHEATLITVAKKRKEYPAVIAAYLGKRRRLQKNTLEVMKVDLPPRAPMEVDGTFNPSAEDLTVKNWWSEGISDSIQHLQPRIQRLDSLGDALNVLQKIRHDPAEIIFSSKSL